MLHPLILLAALVTMLTASAVPAGGVDGDVIFKRKGAGPGAAVEIPPATFPHWVHRIRFKCYACHPQIFQLKAGAADITMDAIVEGKFCGTCHNDKTAWGTSFETCSKCHIGK